jgi:NAD-dependent dihydropyrimidine dehydrogenase PreA subunit
VLCGLCLDASPPGAVKVIKLYDGGVLLEQAA